VDVKQREKRVKNSLRVSLRDGIFASIMSGIMDPYGVPFALFLGATVQEVGWISSAPQLVGSLAQLFASQAIRRLGGRLRLLIRVVLVQATLILAIGFLISLEVSRRVELLLLLLVLTALCGGLAGPAWGSLMSDYIPRSKRGQYFGWRSRILGIANVTAMISAGFWLSWAGKISLGLGLLASTFPPLLGYPLLTLFALSSLRRLVLYFLLFNRFSEVRPSKAVSLQELFFSVVGIRPLIG